VSLGLRAEADVSSVDLVEVRRGSAILAKALHATAALGGDYLGGVIYSALKKYTRSASAVHTRRRGSLLKGLLDPRAASRGIRDVSGVSRQREIQRSSTGTE
jgi:hypothetical protein